MDEKDRQYMDMTYERWKEKGYKVDTVEEKVKFLMNRTGLRPVPHEGDSNSDLLRILEMRFLAI